MKYTYKCIECGEIKNITMSIEQYEYDPYISCSQCKDDEGYFIKMFREYSPTRVEFRGEGFTGAGGTVPKMDKIKRKKDLSESSGVEL